MLLGLGVIWGSSALGWACDEICSTYFFALQSVVSQRMSYGKWQKHRRPNQMKHTRLKLVFPHTHLFPVGQRQSNGLEFRERYNPLPLKSNLPHKGSSPQGHLVLGWPEKASPPLFMRIKLGIFQRNFTKGGREKQAVLGANWFCLPKPVLLVHDS